MATKILFYDDDGDLMFDYAYSAYRDESHDGSTGVCIDITGDASIFIKNINPDGIIRSLFENNKVDLTSYGRVIWIDEENNWSDSPEEESSDNGFGRAAELMGR